jgi:hypothetical protein
LLVAVAQAPIKLLPDNIEHQASNALARALQQHEVQDIVRSIILYTWLLTAFIGTPERWDMTQNNLGNAYSDLPGGDRETSYRVLRGLCWLLEPSVQKSGVCGNMISLSSHTAECLPILFSQGNLQGAKDMLRHAQLPSLVHGYSM